jgi:RNA polymerase sigma factor (sigma-70 family)
MPQLDLSPLSGEARSGSLSAFDDLVERCRPRLVAHVNGRLPPYLRPHAGADIVQAALATASAKVNDSHPESQAAFAAWLGAFVRNALRDWLQAVRRHKRDYRRLLDEQRMETPSDPGAGALEAAAEFDRSPGRPLRHQERDAALHEAMRRLLTAHCASAKCCKRWRPRSDARPGKSWRNFRPGGAIQ